MVQSSSASLCLLVSLAQYRLLGGYVALYVYLHLFVPAAFTLC